MLGCLGDKAKNATGADGKIMPILPEKQKRHNFSTSPCSGFAARGPTRARPPLLALVGLSWVFLSPSQPPKQVSGPREGHGSYC